MSASLFGPPHALSLTISYSDLVFDLPWNVVIHEWLEKANPQHAYPWINLSIERIPATVTAQAVVDEIANRLGPLDMFRLKLSYNQ